MTEQKRLKLGWRRWHNVNELMESTPEQRYERLRQTVQTTILRNFPNPERKGCPGERVVREVASRRELIEDDTWQHVTHCSPCYASFLEFKEEFRTVRRRRGVGLVVGGIAAAILAGVFTFYEISHPGDGSSVHSQDVYETATLDLKDTSPLRGPETQSGNATARFLPDKKLNLTIYLPFGSEPGRYEIQLQKTGQALVTAEENAVVKQGNTVMRVKIDFSKYPPGNYSVAIRQSPWGWHEHAVTLR